MIADDGVGLARLKPSRARSIGVGVQRERVGFEGFGLERVISCRARLRFRLEREGYSRAVIRLRVERASLGRAFGSGSTK